jgi:hypothetical protein
MTFDFRLTTDEALIREAVLSSNNLPWAFESHLSHFTWKPQIRREINYIACYEGEQFMGLVVTIRQTDSRCESHIAFLPCAYGKTSEIGRECIMWIWQNTSYQEIVAPCIQGNSLASRLLTRIGFVKYGIRGKPWIKDGIPQTMDLLKISKSII